MKKIFVILSIAAFLVGCKEDYIGQYPVDSSAPAPIKNPQVENLSGRVIITYDLPNEDDILYVKAIYKTPSGKLNSVKSSIYSNQLEIKGLARSKKQTVKLFVVDRSQNESKPVNVDIEPQDGPSYKILESMKMIETWGGLKIIWDNPDAAPVFVYVNTISQEGDIISDTFYSEEVDGVASVRGLESVPYEFDVVVRDLYNNYSDTLTNILTPWFEEQLPGKEIKVLPLAQGYGYSQWGQTPSTSLFDGDESKILYMDLLKKEPYFSLDLGKEYQLSRMKFWQRKSYEFDLHSPRHFQIWGTSSSEAASVPENWDGWTLIMDDYSHKPSGDDNSTITSNDKAYARAGEEFEFPDGIPSVRYIRFKCLQTWTNSLGLTIAEMKLWGKAVDK